MNRIAFFQRIAKLTVEDIDINEEKGITVDWLNNFKSTVPLQLITLLQEQFYPRIDKFLESSVTDEEVLELIKKSTMVGIFPTPHPLYIRKFNMSTETKAWFTSFIWGLIFMQSHLPLYDPSKIKLFIVGQS